MCKSFPVSRTMDNRRITWVSFVILFNSKALWEDACLALGHSGFVTHRVGGLPDLREMAGPQFLLGTITSLTQTQETRPSFPLFSSRIPICPHW